MDLQSRALYLPHVEPRTHRACRAPDAIGRTDALSTPGLVAPPLSSDRRVNRIPPVMPSALLSLCRHVKPKPHKRMPVVALRG